MNQKLTEDDIKKIIELYDTGNYTFKQLGEMYNVNRRTIEKWYHPSIRNKKNEDRRNYRKNNLEKCREYDKKKAKEYRQTRKEEIANIRKKYFQKKMKNPKLKIEHNLRRRLNTVIKQQKVTKRDHFLKLLGCSLEECKKYLEDRFKEGMTWENYGSVWHIDHIMPCSSFNLLLSEEQKKCFNYKNLQPLFVEDNLKKSDFLSDGKRARDTNRRKLNEQNENISLR